MKISHGEVKPLPHYDLCFAELSFLTPASLTRVVSDLKTFPPSRSFRRTLADVCEDELRSWWSEVGGILASVHLFCIMNFRGLQFYFLFNSNFFRLFYIETFTGGTEAMQVSKECVSRVREDFFRAVLSSSWYEDYKTPLL